MKKIIAILSLLLMFVFLGVVSSKAASYSAGGDRVVLNATTDGGISYGDDKVLNPEEATQQDSSDKLPQTGEEREGKLFFLGLLFVLLSGLLSPWGQHINLFEK